MDIKRAKQEIKDSIEAYLTKDEFGAYRIPAIRQRPVLLMGPPGIGKTQKLVWLHIQLRTIQDKVQLDYHLSKKKYMADRLIR